MPTDQSNWKPKHIYTKRRGNQVLAIRCQLIARGRIHATVLLPKGTSLGLRCTDILLKNLTDKDVPAPKKVTLE